MTSSVANENFRVAKTKRALFAAMLSLLKKYSFKKITIRELSEEALISRATFYAHFIDKYDLLQNWLTDLWICNISSTDTFEQIEKTINLKIQANKPVLKNLVEDADNETIETLFNFMLSTVDLTTQKNSGGAYAKNIVLSNFYAGGMISYLLWQVKNRFPSDVPLMNQYLCEIIHELQDLQTK